MTMTDPIADFLTRLRNANSAYHDEVTLPHSKIKATKGTLELAVAGPISVSRNDDGASVVTRPNDERENRSLHGLSRTLVANLVTGVTEGYTIKMEIFGVGYRVVAKGSNLEFAL